MKKYVVIKVGHRYVHIDQEGIFTIVKSKKLATFWDIEMQPYVEEGMDRIFESGLNARVVICDSMSD